MTFASTMTVSDVHKWSCEGGKRCDWCHWRGGRKIRLSLFIRLIGTSMLMLLPLCEKLNLVMLVHKSIGHRQKWLMNKQNDSVQLDNYWFLGTCSVISSKHLLLSLALGGFFFGIFCAWLGQSMKLLRHRRKEWVAIINQLRRTNDVMNFLFASVVFCCFTVIVKKGKRRKLEKLEVTLI